MQWKKIKTYLIIALAILNFVLVCSIISDNTKYSYKFTKKNMDSLKKILDERNISYNFKLNNNAYKVSPIIISYAKPNDEVYEKIRKNYENNIRVIDDMYVDISENKEILSKEDFLKYCDDFIKNNFDIKDYKIKEIVDNKDSIMVSYEEQYAGISIEQGYVKAIYSQGNINISILKIKSIEELDNEIRSITNAQALSKMIPSLKENDEIESLEICYYINNSDENINTNKLESLRMIPFYRAKLKNGNFIYTPAIVK